MRENVRTRCKATNAYVGGSRAGYFASHWSGTILFGSGVLLAALLTLLLPLVVRLSGGSVALVILMRALVGFCEVCTRGLMARGSGPDECFSDNEPSRHLGASLDFAQGVTLPSLQAVCSNWAPPGERSRIATFSFSGCTAFSFSCIQVRSGVSRAAARGSEQAQEIVIVYHVHVM